MLTIEKTSGGVGKTPATARAWDGSIAANVVPGASDAADTDLFQNTLKGLASGGRSVLSSPSASAPASVTTSATGDNPGDNTGNSPLGALQANEKRIGDMVSRARQTHDMSLALKASVEMGDQAARFDIAAKAIGKTVSAIDQLTKLN